MTNEEIIAEFWETLEAYGDGNLVRSFRRVESELSIGFMQSMIDQMVGNDIKTPKLVGSAHSLMLNTEIICNNKGSLINCMMLPIQLGVLVEWKEAFDRLVKLIERLVRIDLAKNEKLNAVIDVLAAIDSILGMFSTDEFHSIEYLRNYYAHYHTDSYFVNWDDEKKKLFEKRKGHDKKELREKIQSALAFAENDIEKWAYEFAKRTQTLSKELYQATIKWEPLSTVC